MSRYDLAIIGSGPCGYVAGIRAAQLGAKVCIIEKDKLGGTCLNYGCIPTKALIFSAGLLDISKGLGNFGILVDNVRPDFEKMQKRKREVVDKLRSGIEFLLRERKVEIRFGNGELMDKNSVKVDKDIIEAKYCLIATGSMPTEIKNFPFDKRYILSSTELLELAKVPESLTIIGGGVIGCEFANLFNLLGSKVTIVELMDQLLPTEDTEIARTLEVSFRKRGIEIFLGRTATKTKKSGDSLGIELSDGTEVVSEKILISVGRGPATQGLGLEKLGIRLNKGFIVASEDYRTNLDGIFAAGDVIGRNLFAHVASKEGIAIAENLFRNGFKVNYKAIPNCIYTRPEIASIGITQKKAEENSIPIETRKFRFQSLGKSHILGETEGFIKLVVDKISDKVIGCQIVGPYATDIIGEMCLGIELGITSERLTSVIHAHPTFSEIIGEVAEMVHGKGIHSI